MHPSDLLVLTRNFPARKAVFELSGVCLKIRIHG